MFRKKVLEEMLFPAGEAMRGGINRADDAVQAAIRDHILRLPKDGSVLPKEAPMRIAREALGKGIHQARSGYEGDATYYKQNPGRSNATGVGLARALQAGGATAAGVGLANLTHQFQNMFGGPADIQDPEVVRQAEGLDYQANVPQERYYGAEGMLPQGQTNGSPEGELLVAGLKGFGPFAGVDHYTLASRLNDLNEMQGIPPVRGWGERNSADM